MSTGSSRSPKSPSSAPSIEFPYAALGPGSSNKPLKPAVPVVLHAVDRSAAFPQRVIPDSGADRSVFPVPFAKTLGIDLDDDKECGDEKVKTGNGTTYHRVYRKALKATVIDREINLDVAFGDIGVPVVGREDFFAEFLVDFDHRRRIVRITPYDEPLSSGGFDKIKRTLLG